MVLQLLTEPDRRQRQEQEQEQEQEQQQQQQQQHLSPSRYATVIAKVYLGVDSKN